MSTLLQLKQAELDKKLAEVAREQAEREKILKEIEKLQADTRDVLQKSSTGWWWKTNFLQFFVTMATLFGVMGYVYLPYYEHMAQVTQKETDLKSREFLLDKGFQLDSLQRAADLLRAQIEAMSQALVVNRDSVRQSLGQVKAKDSELLKANAIIAGLQSQKKSSAMKSVVGNAPAAGAGKLPTGAAGTLLYSKTDQVIKKGFYVDYDELRIGLIAASPDGSAVININKPHSMDLDHFERAVPNQVLVIERSDGRYYVRYHNWTVDNEEVAGSQPFALVDVFKYSR